MFRQPVRVLAADGAGLRPAPHDEANRAAVRAVPAAALDLVGLALLADQKVAARVTDKLRPHP